MRVHVCVCMHVGACLHACLYVCLFACAYCVHVCLYVRLCACMGRMRLTQAGPEAAKLGNLNLAHLGPEPFAPRHFGFRVQDAGIEPGFKKGLGLQVVVWLDLSLLKVQGIAINN